MKIHIFLMLACCALAPSCGEEALLRLDKRTIEFERSIFFLASDNPETVTVAIGAPAREEIRVPFEVGGTAVPDIEYALQAREFVIPAGESRASITLTPLENYEQKEIRLELLPVEGYKIGNKRVAIVPVAPREMLIWSFRQSESTLVDETVIDIEVRGTQSGLSFRAGSDLHIPFRVMPGSSAVSGENFTVKGGATEFVIPAGQRRGSITLVSGTVEGEPLMLDLSLDAAAERYLPGEIPVISVSVTGLIRFQQIEGRWVFDEFVSEYDGAMDWLVMMCEWEGDDVGRLPYRYEETDAIEFSDAGGEPRLVPSIAGSLGDLLRNGVLSDPQAWKWRNSNSIPMEMVYGTSWLLSDGNRAFSPEEEVLAPLRIGLRLMDGGNRLELYSTDYTPTYFGVNIYAAYGFDVETLVLCWSFTRAE